MVKGAPAKQKARTSAAPRPKPLNMVVMAEHQAFTPAFDALFSAGMALADKVSRYFSGAVEQEAETYPPALARFYEQERKRLGAAVLQMAAWLWLERARREGDMDKAASAAEKKKLHFAAKTQSAAPKDGAAYHAQFAALPQGFRALYAETEHFIMRIEYMDKETAPPAAAQSAERADNAVNRQWQKLRRAFGVKS